MRKFTPAEQKAIARLADRLIDERMDRFTGAIAESPNITREQKEEIYRTLAEVRANRKKLSDL